MKGQRPRGIQSSCLGRSPMSFQPTTQSWICTWVPLNWEHSPTGDIVTCMKHNYYSKGTKTLTEQARLVQVNIFTCEQQTE
jgi:hypothetical protein